jgi:GNAT superfamily N-acetyltransferase
MACVESNYHLCTADLVMVRVLAAGIRSRLLQVMLREGCAAGCAAKKPKKTPTKTHVQVSVRAEARGVGMRVLMRAAAERAREEAAARERRALAANLPPRPLDGAPPF